MSSFGQNNWRDLSSKVVQFDFPTIRFFPPFICFLRHFYHLHILVDFSSTLLFFYVQKPSTTYRQKATGWLLEFLQKTNTTHSLKRTGWLSMSFLMIPKPNTTYPPKGGLADCRVLVVTFDVVYFLSLYCLTFKRLASFLHLFGFFGIHFCYLFVL